MKLKTIANIQTGLVLSRKKAINPDKSEKYKLLNLKCIREEGTIDMALLEEFPSETTLELQYLTKKGDILMRLTSPYTAIYINHEQEGLVISSNFAVIRVKANNILSRYLVELLNTKMIKKQIERSAMGTIMPMLKTSALKEIELKEISLQEQQIIVKWMEGYYQEKKLIEQLQKQRRKMKKQIMLKFI